jgi:septum formation inhibitor MinC
MSSTNALSEIDECWNSSSDAPARPIALLRGSARGLEIVVDGRASGDAIAVAVSAKLGEAPAFFRGSDVRIRVDEGPLALGCLAKLDTIAGQFELRIVEVGALSKDGVPHPNLAAGSAPERLAADQDPAQGSLPLPDDPAPVPVPVVESDPAPAVKAPSIDQLELALRAPKKSTFANVGVEPTFADEPEIEVVEHAPDEPETRIVVGPIRSGVIFEHRGHVIVFGDVNPGAEIRAEGNIVVLGRLRGTAHAGIGRDAGFILALRLEPQQLRICRLVARASEGDTPGSQPEIAHVTSGTIVVERYLGRLPGSLAASI